jgi:hypothetical protein
VILKSTSSERSWRHLALRNFSLFPFFAILALLTAGQADDRFNWQTLGAGPLTVHWYQGDASFGQAALDTAQAGLESIARLIPPNLEEPVEIFIGSRWSSVFHMSSCIS